MSSERKQNKFIDVLSCLGFYLIDYLKNEYYFETYISGNIQKFITFNYLPFVNKQIMNLLLKTYFEKNEFPSYSIENYSTEKQNYIRKIKFVMINQDIEKCIKIPQHIVSLTIGQCVLDFNYRLSKNFKIDFDIINFTSDLFPLNLTELNFYGHSNYIKFSLTKDCLGKLTCLKKLIVPAGFNQKINEIFFPRSLTDLDMGYDFKYPLLHGDLPENLINLKIQYNDQLTKEIFPNQLIKLELFRNEKCNPGIFPETLQELTIYRYNYDLEQDFFPSNLRKLFLVDFNSMIGINSLPKNLTSLQLNSFKQILLPGVLPESLLKLKLHHYNHILEPNVLPKGLLKLQLGFYDKPLKPGIFPNGLLSLKFLHAFNQGLKSNIFPQKLKTLYLGDKFNHKVKGGTLPKSLQTLGFGDNFDQKPYFLDSRKLPELTSLHLFYTYNHQINFDKLQSLSNVVFHKPGYLSISKEIITITKSLECKNDSGNNSEYDWKFYTCLYGSLMWKRKLQRPILQ